MAKNIGDMKAEPPKILADSDLKSDTKSINFLIAGYSRYQCPYVWLRSDAKELIDFEENQVFDRDSPLDLESMRYWRNYDIRPWDVLAEILTNTTLKPDENPFKIDYSFFEKIPVEESVISIGAMLDFLRKVYLRHYVFSDTVITALAASIMGD
ncbi:hypothetical protein H4219_002098 [Mycoemilia scoparia]|uniref:DUF7886 domain-containing protein n=1 Tax=Mycoemilia scoparia TaxID=417184 RepID=A0A9W7ZYA5_9FUNG|nr:hypothetical protein H4219_002098 [Mycoemilia scoparia]